MEKVPTGNRSEDLRPKKVQVKKHRLKTALLVNQKPPVKKWAVA